MLDCAEGTGVVQQAFYTQSKPLLQITVDNEVAFFLSQRLHHPNKTL